MTQEERLLQLLRENGGSATDQQIIRALWPNEESMPRRPKVCFLNVAQRMRERGFDIRRSRSLALIEK